MNIRLLIVMVSKEFKQMRRDKFVPKILFVMPIIQLLIMPFAANFELHNIDFAVVDRDLSTLSKRLTEKVSDSPYFRLSGHYDSYANAFEALEKGDVSVILELPPNFEKDLQNEKKVNVFIASNAVDGNKGGLGSSYLANIIVDFNQNEVINATGIKRKPQSRVTIQNVDNPKLNYKYNMVPGILGILIMMVGMFVSAVNIVKEKEIGTIEQVNVSPLSKSTFLLGKIIPFWISGFVSLTFGIFITWFVYGLTPVGNLGTLYFIVGIFLVASTGLGLTFSNISSTQQQAMLTAFFFMVIFILMSGLFTPISCMPKWAQYLDVLNPLRYLVEVLRMIYLKGSTLVDLFRPIAIITTFALCFNGLALITYHKNN